MKEKINKIIIVLAVVALLAGVVYLVLYLTDAGEIVIPLKEGREWKYQGKYISKGGGSQEITMKAPPHSLVVERAFEFDGEKRYLLVFQNKDSRLYHARLVQNETGLYMIMGRNKKIMVLPRKIKRGMKWKFKIGSEVINAKVGKREKIETPMGQIKARKITYQSARRSRIFIWVDNEHGFVRIRYSFLGRGASRNIVDVRLEKMVK